MKRIGICLMLLIFACKGPVSNQENFDFTGLWNPVKQTSGDYLRTISKDSTPPTILKLDQTQGTFYELSPTDTPCIMSFVLSYTQIRDSLAFETTSTGETVSAIYTADTLVVSIVSNGNTGKTYLLRYDGSFPPLQWPTTYCP